MFSSSTYTQRRDELKKKTGSGIILLPGNDEAPMNYPANTFDFRQDSSFLYYFGLDLPGFSGMIDIDNDRDIVFGNDFTLEDIIWMGPQESVADKAARAGVTQTLPLAALESEIKAATKKGRAIHFLPQYRAGNSARIARLCGYAALSDVEKNASLGLIKAVAAQRSIKTSEEIQEIEAAISISYDMYALAMKVTRPGIYEYEVAGAIQGLRSAKGSSSPFPTICTVHGEVLHGHSYHNRMKQGDLLILDSGADSPNHYASDITRTLPVAGKFSDLQEQVYSIVLAANTGAASMMKPGVMFRDVHLHAARTIASGMKELGFMKGDVDAAVAAGAHALFFPHGLGHLLGLDVHDMEGLGEDHIGYDGTIQRSDQFGLAYLRFAKKLEPGMVLTVEPGIYFMPSLIAHWKSEHRHADFIDYEKVRQHLDFTGIRIEDDVLVTQQGSRVLGKPIPKAVQEMENNRT
ncbi:MAG: aminopeptidase P N-terminal domain-containing protein [Chitinispirillaceae bacterium]|nr:aminopeptidase P N-terminal domain-containing protein [Chitinispirillaceae bacterium]